MLSRREPILLRYQSNCTERRELRKGRVDAQLPRADSSCWGLRLLRVRDIHPLPSLGFKAPFQGDLKPNPLSFLAEHFSQAVQFLWSHQEVRQGGACVLHILSLLGSEESDAVLNHFHRSLKRKLTPSRAGARRRADLGAEGAAPHAMLFSPCILRVLLKQLDSSLRSQFVLQGLDTSLPDSCPLWGAVE